MAEGEGFEPPEPFRVQWFSRPPPSTTRPSLRQFDYRMRDIEPFLTALEERHLANLTRSEVTRALRALSSCYVERRGKLESGAPLDGAGKRAAFALFYGPLHFIIISEVLRALDAGNRCPEDHSRPRMRNRGGRRRVGDRLRTRASGSRNRPQRVGGGRSQLDLRAARRTRPRQSRRFDPIARSPDHPITR